MIVCSDCWSSRTKCKHPLSTFNEGAFHISLQDPHTDPDYLPLSLYNDILPYYTIPGKFEWAPIDSDIYLIYCNIVLRHVHILPIS